MGKKFFKPQGSRDKSGKGNPLSLRLLKSYGATTEIFSFFDQQMVTQFQAFNLWMYEHGVSRVQTRLRFDTRYKYIVCNIRESLKSSYWKFDTMNGRGLFY